MCTCVAQKSKTKKSLNSFKKGWNWKEKKRNAIYAACDESKSNNFNNYRDDFFTWFYSINLLDSLFLLAFLSL